MNNEDQWNPGEDIWYSWAIVLTIYIFCIAFTVVNRYYFVDCSIVNISVLFLQTHLSVLIHLYMTSSANYQSRVLVCMWWLASLVLVTVCRYSSTVANPLGRPSNPDGRQPKKIWHMSTVTAQKGTNLHPLWTFQCQKLFVDSGHSSGLPIYPLEAYTPHSPCSRKLNLWICHWCSTYVATGILSYGKSKYVSCNYGKYLCHHLYRTIKFLMKNSFLDQLMSVTCTSVW